MDITIAGAVWWHLVLALVAGAALVNGIPHFVQGISGKQFPSPFSGGPPKLDSAVHNVLWGAFNFLLGGVLLWVVSPSFASPALWVLMALAGLGFSVMLAHVFSHPPAAARGKGG